MNTEQNEILLDTCPNLGAALYCVDGKYLIRRRDGASIRLHAPTDGYAITDGLWQEWKRRDQAAREKQS